MTTEMSSPSVGVSLAIPRIDLPSWATAFGSLRFAPRFLDGINHLLIRHHVPDLHMSKTWGTLNERMA